MNSRNGISKMLVFDERKCVGCRRCEYACSYGKTGKMSPACSRIHNFPFRKEGVFVSVTCMQCEQAFCASVCPVGAISRAGSGAMVVNEQRCVGCKMCVQACPFGGMIYCVESGTVIKCDLCDGSPACVGACPTSALQYMSPEDAAMKRRFTVAEGLKRLLGH